MYRKIEDYINNCLNNYDDKILCIYGARQIGKTYIINKTAPNFFSNYVEINFDEDNKDEQLFKNVKSTSDFYIQLTAKYGNKLSRYEDTLIFIDEIQVYPQFLSLLKQLNIDKKYHYICSGSQLGIALLDNGLSPMGSVIEKKMYPMDFEEFLLANGTGKETIDYLKKCFINKETVNEALHTYIMNMFKSYLFVGGLPECVKIFVEEKDVSKIKDIQSLTYRYYGNDASKYDEEKKLKIRHLYEMIISNMENNVKRIQVSKINNNVRDTYSKYENEFEYLTNSSIALASKAVSQPKFPLVQSYSKNLTKLYFNDVGILSERLYKNNINAILKDKTGVNLGSIYETVVAQELSAHGHKLFYYDRRKVGEVDFLVDNYDNLSTLPIEIKSGKESFIYKALPKLVEIDDYHILFGYVLSNKKDVIIKNKIIEMPIYNIMFI